MSEEKWSNRIKRWFCDYRWTMIIVVSMIISAFLFVWNVSSAAGCNSNVLTAISGWVSFLATFGIGIITLIVSKHFSDESSKATRAMKECVDRIEECVDKIDDSLWRQNMPVVISTLHSDIKVTYVNKPEAQWEQYTYSNEDDVHFEVTPEDKTVGDYICTRIVEFPIKNYSPFPVQSIDCYRIHVSTQGPDVKRLYYNQADIAQGFIYPNEEKRCIIEISDFEPLFPVEGENLSIDMEMKYSDIRGNSFFSVWQLWTGSLVFEEDKIHAHGKIDDVWYQTKRNPEHDERMDVEEYFAKGYYARSLSQMNKEKK